MNSRLWSDPGNQQDIITAGLLEKQGIYSLILALEDSRILTPGALGNVFFSESHYVYTGSARGSGGFARVRRHLQVACGDNNARRWHIDYLLPYTMPVGVVLSPTHLDLECPICGILDSSIITIAGFGCSDCKCGGHLHLEKSINRLIRIVMKAHKKVSGISPNYLNIKDVKKK